MQRNLLEVIAIIDSDFDSVAVQTNVLKFVDPGFAAKKNA